MEPIPHQLTKDSYEKDNNLRGHLGGFGLIRVQRRTCRQFIMGEDVGVHERREVKADRAEVREEWVTVRTVFMEVVTVWPVGMMGDRVEGFTTRVEVWSLC